MKNYTIAVAGTGYVGLSIATLLSQNHKVYAVSQMFDKVFGMIKSDMYAIKLQEKVRELSVLDTTNRQIRVICLKKSIR